MQASLKTELGEQVFTIKHEGISLLIALKAELKGMPLRRHYNLESQRESGQGGLRKTLFSGAL